MNKIKISNELLTEVLENDSYFKDCDSFKVLENTGGQILISYCYPFYDNYGSDGSCDCSFKKGEGYINIYEFALKCKELIYQKYSYRISSDTNGEIKYFNIWTPKDTKEALYKNEVEAIIGISEQIISKVE